MTRPSRNTDRSMLDVGLTMVKEAGVTSLNIRDLATRAGVNLGMFHYHFKTKDAFARQVLQEIYDANFVHFTAAITAHPEVPAVDQLRGVLGAVARFAREERSFLAGLAMDLANGSAVVRDFVQTNFPRHMKIIFELLVKAQAEGGIVNLAPPTLIAFIASSIMGPSFAAAMVTRVQGEQFAWLPQIFETFIFSDEAIEQRLDLVMRGIRL